MTSQYEMQFPFTTRKEILDWERRYIEDQWEKRQCEEQAVIDLKEKVLTRKTPETPQGYLSQPELHHMAKWKDRDAYKRRAQIEHGFRDIKTRFGFRHIVLKKPEKARIQLLWFIACLTYGFTFLCYEKTIHSVAAHRNTRRKLYAVITLIKDRLMET